MYVVARSCKELVHSVKDPSVEFGNVLCGKVLVLVGVVETAHPAARDTLGEHGEDVGAAPAPSPARLVEHCVKVGRILK
jgi:hypothetical protein